MRRVRFALQSSSAPPHYCAPEGTISSAEQLVRTSHLEEMFRHAVSQVMHFLMIWHRCVRARNGATEDLFELVVVGFKEGEVARRSQCFAMLGFDVDLTQNTHQCGGHGHRVGSGATIQAASGLRRSSAQVACNTPPCTLEPKLRSAADSDCFVVGLVCWRLYFPFSCGCLAAAVFISGRRSAEHA